MQPEDDSSALPGSPGPLRPRGSSQLGMRQFNERVVLHTLRVHGALPKADLARLTGLTAQTIGLITTRLEDDGLLLRHAPVRGRIGQPSVPLALDPDGAFAIGVKIGRRSTDCLLVDFTGTVRQRFTQSYAFPDAPALLPLIGQKLRSITRSLGSAADRLVGVGVAVPFQMGGWHRMLGLSPAQADAWNQRDIAAEVRAMTPLPVHYAKDTSAACVAELLQGRGREIKSFLYLFVDTFIGGGLVIDSKLLAGVRGNAGAVASLPLGLAGPAGAPAQLVGSASLWELERQFAAQGLDGTAAYDQRALQAPWQALTHDWMDSAATALAHAVVCGTAVADTDAVVIDGSLAPQALAQLIERSRDALERYNWEGLWRPVLHAGVIGADARALGGALLPLQANFAPDSAVFLKAI